MQYHMLYVERKKSFKVRREKKLVSLPSVKQIHSANIFLYRVPNNYTRQTYFFAECICLPSVSTNRHSANVLKDGTRTNGCLRGGSLPSAQLLPSVFFSGLPSAKLCRVFFVFFAEYFFKALGEKLFYRVPDIMHSPITQFPVVSIYHYDILVPER